MVDPPPVRGRSEFRWGLPGLQGSHAAVLLEDNVLWLRFLLLYGVAQAVAEGPPTEIPVVEDRAKWEVPTDITDPLLLAKWALHKAAESLCTSGGAGHSSRASGEGGVPVGRRVFFVWEHPTDPEEYMPRGKRPAHGWASWWVFPEWVLFARVYDVYVARFD